MYEPSMATMTSSRPFYGYPGRDHSFEVATQRTGKPRKLRSACDACHQAKIKCSGGVPCARCTKDGRHCRYSFTARVGKPKGSKNKKTLEKMRLKAQEAGETLDADRSSEQQQQQMNQEQQQSPTQQQTPPESASSSTVQRLPSIVSEPEPRMKVDLSPTYANLQPVTTLAEFPPMPDMAFASYEGSAHQGGWMVPLSPSPTSLPEVFDMHSASVPLPFPPVQTGAGHGGDDDFVEPYSGQQSRRASLPLTPNSNRAYPYGAETAHSPLAATLEAAAEVMDELGCNCLQDQASRMFQLREIESGSSPPPLDAVINYTTVTLRDTEQVLRCGGCHTDAQVVQMSLMNLQTVFRWADMSVDDRSRSLPPLDVSIGAYAVPEEVASLVKGTLVSSILVNSRVVLVELEARLANMGRMMPSGEVDPQVLFLHSSLEGLKAQLDLLNRSLDSPQRPAQRRCKSMSDAISVF